MMKMEPVILSKFAFKNFAVVYLIVGNLSICKHKCYCVIPWLYAFATVVKIRCINGYFGWYFKLNSFLIDFRVTDLSSDTGKFAIGDYLEGHISCLAFLFKDLVVFKCK